MDYDRYLSQKLAEHDKSGKELCRCEECGKELYEGEDCHYIGGNYYCKDCIKASEVTLDTDDFNPFED